MELSPLPLPKTSPVKAPTVGALRVMLPLYPGAKKLSDPGDMSWKPTQNSPYLDAVRADYVTLADADSVASWYSERLTALGYKEAMANQPYITYEADQVQITLDFLAIGSGKTVIQYWVTAIATPARTSASLIPIDVTELEVEYHSGRGTATVRRTITDRADVMTLVRMVNGLSRDTRGTHGCTMDGGAAATLDFLSGAGEHSAVTLLPACYSAAISGTPLYDQNLQLWRAVARMLDATP